MLLDTLQHFSGHIKGRLLDLGCGNKPYCDIYTPLCSESVGCDVPHSLHKDSNVEVECSAEDIDKYFAPQSFDTILCTEVIEHTIDDRKVAENIGRLLKPGGAVIISAPFTYVLHEAPHDYRRYTLYGLSRLLEDNGFEISSSAAMGGTFSSAFFICHYWVMKTFYFILKKFGLSNLRNNTVLKFFWGLPELLMYKTIRPSFMRKLREGKNPSVYENFSSSGYLLVARKRGSGK